jgi:flagellar transcriptional activator FlhC
MPIETKHAERRIRSLKIAKECAELGARFRTICCITGLTHREVNNLFFADSQSIPRGRAPESPEWYHGANLLNRIEASIVISIYRRIRDLGFAPAEALVAGYRHYQAACRQRPRVSFDRAFDLVSHVDGLWLATNSNLSLLKCETCDGQYLATASTHSISNQDCPFCKLLTRYRLDARIQAAFPLRDISDPSGLQLGLLALAQKHDA